MRTPGWRLAALALCWLFVVATGAGATDPFSSGRLVPVAVKDGRCDFVVPTPRGDEQYYVIVGSLARDLGPHRVTIRTTPTTDPVTVASPAAPADTTWTGHIDAIRRRLERAWAEPPPLHEYRPVADPPKQKSFHLFMKARDFNDPAGYVEVIAERRAIGQHCQVYVDRDHRDADALACAVKDVVATFDEEIYPQARRRLGRAEDVDRDGRFTILFTPRLGKLVGGTVKLDGFVRGCDFYRDLAAPFGNRCDMMYLNTDLRPGPYLRTLLAHEYTHAVVFSEHVLADYQPDAPRQDEEGWLNEALAHLNEDVHGYSWSNLDYRISAFLAEPSRYSLVVPDYYAAGIWRSHGHRGATYLFLRWCVDRYGVDLLRRLVQTNLNGVENVEAATRAHFADLFRQWTVALLLGDTGMSMPSTTPLRQPRLWQPLGGRLLTGPRVDPMTLAGDESSADLAGTAAAYWLLHSPNGKAAHVTIKAEPEALLQVSVVCLPCPAGRLVLGWENATKRQLLLTANGMDVTLDAVAWERVPPPANRPEDTSYRPGEANDVRTWFGEPNLGKGKTRRALAPLPRPGPGERFVIKLAGTDEAGHRISAWAAVP